MAPVRHQTNCCEKAQLREASVMQSDAIVRMFLACAKIFATPFFIFCDSAFGLRISFGLRVSAF
jgi:hypothetical protein